MADYRQTPMFQDTLDYPGQIQDQIGMCRHARNEGNFKAFTENVSTLDDMMNYCYDDEYRKEIQGITTDARNKMMSARTPGEKEQIIVDRSRLVFRELIKLIGRSGFLPMKEVEGVISEFDAKVIDEILRREKEEIEKDKIEKEKIADVQSEAVV
jgi:hypothetical protein